MKANKESKLEREIEIPEGVEAKSEGNVLTVKGAAGETSRIFAHPNIKILAEGKRIVISAARTTKREIKMANTFRAHVNNMIMGATAGHVYRLKICSGHFPMNVSMSQNTLVVKNFFGEKQPRKLAIMDKVKVKVDGQEITVESIQKEAAGQTAADIEQLTRRTRFDRRIFQDGIYITEKDGKAIK